MVEYRKIDEHSCNKFLINLDEWLNFCDCVNIKECNWDQSIKKFSEYINDSGIEMQKGSYNELLNFVIIEFKSIWNASNIGKK